MEKFKVGDRVKFRDWSCQNTFNNREHLFGIVIGTGERKYDCPACGRVTQDMEIECGSKRGWVRSCYFTKEKPMFRYEDLKGRIEALDNGWTKEADNILQEIKGKNCFTILEGVYNVGKIIIDANTSFLKAPQPITSFYYDNQCEKLTAFKLALLWLLDHSDIKKDLVGQEIKIDKDGEIYKVKVLERL